jgi:hypothetical protein
MVMNERIKLPAQEWLGYDPEKGDIHGYTFEQMREFAELIVQECASIIESQDVDPAFRHRMSWAMQEHFGVEE